MYPHHIKTVNAVRDYFEDNAKVLAVLLTGSIAHHYESESSDVDILVVVSDEDYKQRLSDGTLAFSNTELADYPRGYVDGKYISLKFMRQVARIGSEPAKYAFEGAQIIFSRIPELEEDLRKCTRYPLEEKSRRMQQFYAQLQTWRWYCREAIKGKNEYLLGVAIDKLILFGGRIVLAQNETLYPFHKWFLRVLAEVPIQPPNLMALIHEVLRERTSESIEAFYQAIESFGTWEQGNLWPARFMLDSELSWMNGSTAIDDL